MSLTSDKMNLIYGKISDIYNVQQRLYIRDSSTGMELIGGLCKDLEDKLSEFHEWQEFIESKYMQRIYLRNDRTFTKVSKASLFNYLSNISYSSLTYSNTLPFFLHAGSYVPDNSDPVLSSVTGDTSIDLYEKTEYLIDSNYLSGIKIDHSPINASVETKDLATYYNSNIRYEAVIANNNHPYHTFDIASTVYPKPDLTEGTLISPAFATQLFTITSTGTNQPHGYTVTETNSNFQTFITGNSYITDGQTNTIRALKYKIASTTYDYTGTSYCTISRSGSVLTLTLSDGLKALIDADFPSSNPGTIYITAITINRTDKDLETDWRYVNYGYLKISDGSAYISDLSKLTQYNTAIDSYNTAVMSPLQATTAKINTTSFKYISDTLLPTGLKKSDQVGFENSFVSSITGLKLDLTNYVIQTPAKNTLPSSIIVWNTKINNNKTSIEAIESDLDSVSTGKYGYFNTPPSPNAPPNENVITNVVYKHIFFWLQEFIDKNDGEQKGTLYLIKVLLDAVKSYKNDINNLKASIDILTNGEFESLPFLAKPTMFPTVQTKTEDKQNCIQVLWSAIPLATVYEVKINGNFYGYAVPLSADLTEPIKFYDTNISNGNTYAYSVIAHSYGISYLTDPILNDYYSLNYNFRVYLYGDTGVVSDIMQSVKSEESNTSDSLTVKI